MAEMEDRWLSVDEIGKYLGISSDTGYRWIDKHAMPAHRMGRLWKFKKDQDKYLDPVKSIQVGDRIAIKTNYTRKHDLPFDNRGRTVSVMAIKAIGTVRENPGDGRTLKVDWKPFDPPREWYRCQSQNHSERIGQPARCFRACSRLI